MSRTNEEIRKWDTEVDNVTADLIRNGVPPYDAAIRAIKIVSSRRKRKAVGLRTEKGVGIYGLDY